MNELNEKLSQLLLDWLDAEAENMLCFFWFRPSFLFLSCLCRFYHNLRLSFCCDELSLVSASIGQLFLCFFLNFIDHHSASFFSPGSHTSHAVQSYTWGNRNRTDILWLIVVFLEPNRNCMDPFIQLFFNIAILFSLSADLCLNLFSLTLLLSRFKDFQYLFWVIL